MLAENYDTKSRVEKKKLRNQRNVGSKADLHVIYRAIFPPVWLPIVPLAKYPGPVVSRTVKLSVSAFFAGLLEIEFFLHGFDRKQVVESNSF